MPAASVLSVVTEAPAIRRFDTADFSKHGAWIVPRMLKAYPHLNDRGVATFMQNIVYNNEFLLLYSETGVALAQVMSAHTLSAKPVIHERFVWVPDPENVEQVKNAAEFYVHFHRWAKSIGAEVILVEENSDVPHELVREKLGRIFTLQQQFARV